MKQEERKQQRHNVELESTSPTHTNGEEPITRQYRPWLLLRQATFIQLFRGLRDLSTSFVPCNIHSLTPKTSIYLKSSLRSTTSIHVSSSGLQLTSLNLQLKPFITHYTSGTLILGIYTHALNQLHHHYHLPQTSSAGGEENCISHHIRVQSGC